MLSYIIFFALVNLHKTLDESKPQIEEPQVEKPQIEEPQVEKPQIEEPQIEGQIELKAASGEVPFLGILGKRSQISKDIMTEIESSSKCQRQEESDQV